MISYSKEIKWLLKEKYKGKLTPKAWEDIHKFKRGEHIDYLIGFKYFLNCKIGLSKRPFIPRTETEYWVQFVIEDMKTPRLKPRRLPREDNPDLKSGLTLETFDSSTGKPVAFSKFRVNTRVGKSIKILDIFSGSGCIGISILKNCPNSKVTFIDIEKRCLNQIKINLLINDVSLSKAKIIRSNIFSLIKNKKYDYILANPPYVPTHSSNIEKSVLINEPKKAIFGGTDGTSYINEFLRTARKYLKKNGKIYMEFDSDQKKKVENLLKKYGYKSFKFNKDQFKRFRWVEIW